MDDLFERVKNKIRLPKMKVGKIYEPAPVIPIEKPHYKINPFNRLRVLSRDVLDFIDGKKLIFGGIAVLIGETVLSGGLSLLVQGVGYALAGVGASHGVYKITKGEGKVSWEIIVKAVIELVQMIIEKVRRKS